MEPATREQIESTNAWWEALGREHGQQEFLAVVQGLPTPLSDKAVFSLQDRKYAQRLLPYFRGYKRGLRKAAATWIKEGLELWNADQTI